jgi:hypothetical protein
MLGRFAAAEGDDDNGELQANKLKQQNRKRAYFKIIKCKPIKYAYMKVIQVKFHTSTERNFKKYLGSRNLICETVKDI